MIRRAIAWATGAAVGVVAGGTIGGLLIVSDAPPLLWGFLIGSLLASLGMLLLIRSDPREP